MRTYAFTFFVLAWGAISSSFLTWTTKSSTASSPQWPTAAPPDGRALVGRLNSPPNVAGLLHTLRHETREFQGETAVAKPGQNRQKRDCIAADTI